MHWKAGAEIPFSQEWIKGFPLRDSNEIQQLFQKDSGLLHKASPGLKASQRMPWLLQTVQWPLRAAELHTCFCSNRPRAFAMTCPRIHLLFTWNTVQTPHISLHSWITEALSASPQPRVLHHFQQRWWKAATIPQFAHHSQLAGRLWVPLRITPTNSNTS